MIMKIRICEKLLNTKLINDSKRENQNDLREKQKNENNKQNYIVEKQPYIRLITYFCVFMFFIGFMECLHN